MANRELLSDAGVSIDQELLTLKESNTKFRHLTIKFGGIAAATFQEASNIGKLINNMHEHQNDNQTLNTLFKLTFARLLNIIENDIEKYEEIGDELKRINKVMQTAVSNLRDA
jgi:hypothetical protein